MKVLMWIVVLGLVFGLANAWAADNYFITVTGTAPGWQSVLSGYPGRCWGKAADRVFLAGGANEIAWLDSYNIAYSAVSNNGEALTLYLCYIASSENVISSADILTSGPGYVVTGHPVTAAGQYRALSLRKLTFEERSLPSEIIQIYDSHIDSLISHVSRDTIIYYLTCLSGEAPIEINGGVDTLDTRYSGTYYNRLAAQYLKERLEGYGYQTEYHNFYGGTLRHVAAFDGNRAWTVTESSEALRTTDGGTTWVTMPDNSSYELWGVENIGPDSVWLAGNYGTVRFSTDGGATFANQTTGLNAFLFGVDFINSRQGWIAADLGRVLHTTNSGQTWTTQTTGLNSRLYDLCFVDSLYGWAVGRDGTIGRTTNGGANWTRQTSNTTQRLYGVDFINRDNGWVVGWGGVVLHTTNGGANWLTVSLGDVIEKYHVDFVDSLHGCIVGWQGGIYVTSNGGADWTQIITPIGKDFHGLKFVDQMTGFAVGNGIIAKTTDGGQSWIDQTSTVESAWRNVVATKLGVNEPGQQVIICAHYDNTSGQAPTLAPGSDDNGSGAIGVIEAARILSDVDFSKTIKFCLWTGEEQGLLGSQAYAIDAAARGDTIVGVFNYDMIAYDGNDDGSIELHCGTMPSSQELGNIFMDVLTDYNIALAPEYITFGSTDRSDHASFWDQNFPAILGIEDYSGDFNPFYHTIGDNMSIVDSTFFTNFVRAGLGSVATLAILDTQATPGCAYIPGDINGNGQANGIDVVYGVVYFKGGTPPPTDCGAPLGPCPQASPFYAAGDVNGSCVFNGIDITYFVGVLRGSNPGLLYCPTCPPPLR